MRKMLREINWGYVSLAFLAVVCIIFLGVTLLAAVIKLIGLILTSPVALAAVLGTITGVVLVLGTIIVYRVMED